MNDQIEHIRYATRRMVRHFGLMGGLVAGTNLSPSAVYALIEIGSGRSRSATELADTLKLDKSSISRMLRKLIEMGEVREQPDRVDGRLKTLSLTREGWARLAAIDAHSRTQVMEALGHLTPDEVETVVKGLRLYSDALSPAVARRQAIGFGSGYRTGLIARITDLHAQYYSRTSGFGQRFESVVARGLADFCDRLDNPVNQIWVALLGNEVVGSIAIDGEDMGPGKAHLRWFIMTDVVRGSGAGRHLLKTALDHVDRLAIPETHLWTFDGLAAARHLYETSGFRLAEERRGDQWGSEVLEQRFVRPTP